MKTTTEFGQALQEAIKDKNVVSSVPVKKEKKRKNKPQPKKKVKEEPTVEQYVWRDKSGNDQLMLEMSDRDLKVAYKHAYEMLHNTSQAHPGRYKVLDSVMDMYRACNAELLLRYLLYDLDIPNLKTNLDLMRMIETKRKEMNVENTDYITTIFNGMPKVFENLTINDLLAACFDKLGIINRKLISDKFILSQGIWLTNEEKEQLTEYDEEGNPIDKKEVIKTRLFLNSSADLHFTTKGLTYTEFRSLVQIDQFPKVSKLSTTTLKALRDKVLLLVANSIQWHIDKWERIIKQLQEVAARRNIEL